MSQLSMSQSSLKHHVCHLLLMMSDSKTRAWIWEFLEVYDLTWGEMGMEGRERSKRVLSTHHFMSSGISYSGVLGMRGCQWRSGSLPQGWWGMLNWLEELVMWPCNFCTSTRECVHLEFQSISALTYLTCLDSVRVTMWFTRSHFRPMKLGFEEIGMSLDNSQGMSSWLVILSTLSRLYLNLIFLWI